MGRDQVPVITGFGTSKMGVARQLSLQAEAGRLAVKVNEFGKLRVDSELLRECDDASTGAMRRPTLAREIWR